MINTATNLIDTSLEKVETTKIGHAIKDIAITTKDEIHTEKLVLFQKLLEKYSKLYSEMPTISQKFDMKIDVLRSSYSGIYLFHKDMHETFIQTLGLDVDHPFESLDLLFNRNKMHEEDFDFEQVLCSEKIKAGLDFIEDIPNVEEETKKYAYEFASSSNNFITDYLKTLHIPINNSWSAEEIDIKKLSQVIAKLESFIKSNIKIKAVSRTITNPTHFMGISFQDEISHYVSLKN